jgi:hypothetical protein
MKDASTVAGNTASGDGGGVNIRWNISTYPNTEFRMSGTASVRDNRITDSGSPPSYNAGAGVYAWGYSYTPLIVPVTLEDSASITGNHLEGGQRVHGGGIALFEYASLTLSDNAIISGNSVTKSAGSNSINLFASGGGVSVGAGSSLTMEDNSRVSGNAAIVAHYYGNSYGGGVYIGNHLSTHYNYPATFTLKGNASIEGNVATSASNSSKGGGVYLGAEYSTFRKDTSTSTIYGSGGTGLTRNAANDGGAAIYASRYAASSDAADDVFLNNTVSGVLSVVFDNTADPKQQFSAAGWSE